MKKVFIFLNILILLIVTTNAFAYSGCRKLTGEYSTILFEKYAIDIGQGKIISLVLRCEADCFSLLMTGAVSGNASKCGETELDKGTWSYSSCGKIKFTDYGVGVQGVANAMLKDCQ